MQYVPMVAVVPQLQEVAYMPSDGDSFSKFTITYEEGETQCHRLRVILSCRTEARASVHDSTRGLQGHRICAYYLFMDMAGSGSCAELLGNWNGRRKLKR
jgi:hypothetical protein